MTDSTNIVHLSSPVQAMQANTLSVHLSAKNLFLSIKKQDIVPSHEKFARYLDEVICGQINDIGILNYEMTVELMHGPLRNQPIVQARHIAAYILRNMRVSFPKIGRLYNRDHTTIMSSYNRAQGLLESKSLAGIRFQKLYKRVCRELERQKLAERANDN